MTRLDAVAGLIPVGSRVADVGTGHGILPRRLLASGRARHCVATELRLRPGHRLGFRAGHRLATRLELREGDGLAALRPADRVDVVVVSGLGARKLLRILESPTRPSLGAPRLVLQPQSEPALVRRWLHEHDHRIVAETVVLERGRFYEVIAAEPGAPGVSAAFGGLALEDCFAAGPCLIRQAGPLVRLRWETARRHRSNILDRLPPGPARRAAERSLDQARRVLSALDATTRRRALLL